MYNMYQRDWGRVFGNDEDIPPTLFSVYVIRKSFAVLRYVIRQSIDIVETLISRCIQNASFIERRS